MHVISAPLRCYRHLLVTDQSNRQKGKNVDRAGYSATDVHILGSTWEGNTPPHRKSGDGNPELDQLCLFSWRCLGRRTTWLDHARHQMHPTRPGFSVASSCNKFEGQ